MSEAEKLRIRNITRATVAQMIHVWKLNGMPNPHDEELEEAEVDRILARLRPLSSRLVKR